MLDTAEEELEGMSGAERKVFDKHFTKIENMPPRRHMRLGIPYNVEEVGQGRIIYDIRGDDAYILHCFRTHKEYEKWYKSAMKD